MYQELKSILLKSRLSSATIVRNLRTYATLCSSSGPARILALHCSPDHSAQLSEGKRRNAAGEMPKFSTSGGENWNGRDLAESHFELGLWLGA